jgi:hypothetical protein
MEPPALDTGLRRLVTGFRCEEHRCYEMGTWLVCFNGETFHWCPRHTRARMKDQKWWEVAARASVRR